MVVVVVVILVVVVVVMVEVEVVVGGSSREFTLGLDAGCCFLLILLLSGQACLVFMCRDVPCGRGTGGRACLP